MNLKINLLNEKINVDPERKTEVSEENYLKIFFKINNVATNIKGLDQLTDSDINVLVKLLLNRDPQETGIAKSNMYKVYQSLENKGLLVNKQPKEELVNLTRFLLKNNPEIVFNFKIIKDDTG